MRTVEKALKLLDFFTDKVVEIGLSDLARLSGIDKATVLRMLNDMAESGLVEQNPESKRWRLGAGVLRLARLREATQPVNRVLMPILERLAEQTGETAHVSLVSGRDLANIGVVESNRANRVHIEPGLTLPLHATASGLAFTAFTRPERRERVLARKLTPITGTTPITREALAGLVTLAQQRGYSCADQTYEAEVHGLAVPLFGPDGFSCGALAVAIPTSRVTDAYQRGILAALAPAAREATLGLGGRIPPHHIVAL
ncbi:IclR family transcriptional regulator [Pararhodobacter zhoushanensis]|uniref:IclR family transcriptional regulator n=1 Tax=Pararhodobacter zhoushanensis TaxID=2479545 RepID=A0ABT3H4M1_9RHOB|nr:IclR family transcriptional regulator [Pararhodobacter zhoushanensis]MCW1934754.1 IclR family transcriptional regulator [Pararhodobacter zhoushanensis]